jgi:hypothetical protein
MEKFKLDQNLRRFATDRQWEQLTAWDTHGSSERASKALGITRQSLQNALQAVKRKAAQSGYAPAHGLTHALPDGLVSRGPSILYDANGNIERQWVKGKLAGRDPEEAIKLADPKKIVSLATNLDAQGNVLQQWVKEKPEDIQRERLWREFAKELAAELPRAEPVTAPEETDDHLMAVYPVGDHHLGMLAWDKETGADYDLSIGEALLTKASAYLIDKAPSCSHAAVIFLGDFLHYDSMESVTPTSRNQLDSDSRYPKMVRVAVRCMRFMIEQAARRHAHVRVIVEIGNHDLASSIFLMECLANIYENDPRITVDTSPMHFHYFDFGQCLVMTHHGHGTAMANLPLIMASDRPEEWGRTRYRYAYTGHIHQRKTQAAVSAQDFSGVTVESFRILAPSDAWAHQKGYRPIRDMKSIILHREFGEVARHTVNPSMF